MELLNSLIVHKVTIVTIVILSSLVLWKIFKDYHYHKKSLKPLKRSHDIEPPHNMKPINANRLDHLSKMIDLLFRLRHASIVVDSRVRDFEQVINFDDDELRKNYPDIYEMIWNILYERRSILIRCDTLVTQLEKGQAPDDLDGIISNLEDDVSKLITTMESLPNLIDSKLKETLDL